MAPHAGPTNSDALAKLFWQTYPEGRPLSEVPGAGYPSVRQILVSSPAVMRRLEFCNALHPDAPIRPFSFMLSSSVRRGTERVPVVAPYEPDPEKWQHLDWAEYKTGAVVHMDAESKVTIGIYPQEYAIHPEAQFLGPDGKPCSFRTGGLLQRQTMHATGAWYEGRTSVDEEVQAHPHFA